MRYSLEWTDEGRGRHTAGEYVITAPWPRGAQLYVLRYRGTILAEKFSLDGAKREADYHRGVRR